MSVTYEQLRTAALEMIGFAEHSDFCDWHEKKPCSCGYAATYEVIREAGKSTFTPDGKTEPEPVAWRLIRELEAENRTLTRQNGEWQQKVEALEKARDQLALVRLDETEAARGKA